MRDRQGNILTVGDYVEFDYVRGAGKVIEIIEHKKHRDRAKVTYNNSVGFHYFMSNEITKREIEDLI